MAAMEIAIKIGTSYTSVYLSGAGVVLHEPSVVAFVGEGEKKKVIAVGREAKSMRGVAPDRTTVVSPVIDGYVTDVEACTLMMTEFIKKILPVSYLLFPKIKALLVVPTGLSVQERKIYTDIVLKSGVADVTMVDNSIATALGFDLPIETPAGGLVANIGGGITEISIVSMCGTVTGCSVSVGGNMMDKALIDYCIGKYGFKIGAETARKAKEEIASLYPNDVSSIEVRGLNISTMTPAAITLYATDLYEVLMPYYGKIADAIEGITNLCPPEIAAGVHAKGLFVCGGGAKITGIERVLKPVLYIPVTVADDPEFTAIVGAGKLLGNDALMEKIHLQS